MIIKRLFFVLLILIISSCVSPLIKVTDYSSPIQLSKYSILPPQGDDWYYYQASRGGIYELVFGRNIPSRTHTVIGAINELHHYAKFDSPEEFFAYFKKNKEMRINPQRFTFDKNEFSLSDKFSNYSVQFSFIAKDYDARNKGNSDYLIYKEDGYAFIHPYHDDIIVEIQYSERGMPEEIDSNFEAAAQQFINGLHLVDPKSDN